MVRRSCLRSVAFMLLPIAAAACGGIPKPGRTPVKIGKLVCMKPGEDISSSSKFGVNAQFAQFLSVGGGIGVGAKAATKAKASGRAEEVDIWTFKLCEAVGNRLIDKGEYKEFVLRLIGGPAPRQLPEKAAAKASAPRRAGAPAPAAAGGGAPAGEAKVFSEVRPPSEDRILDPELRSLYPRVPAFRRAIEGKDYSLARYVLEGRMKQNAGDPEVLFALGEMYFRGKDYAKAGEMFRGVKKLQPARAMAYTRLGESLERRGRIQEALGVYGEALKYFENALKKEKDSPSLLFGLAEAQFGLRQAIRASATYGRVTRSDPGFARAYLRQGWILYDLGKLDRAHALYQKGISLQKQQLKKMKGS